jgi:transcriptional regulator with GAF, ATPase, and Fis domain
MILTFVGTVSYLFIDTVRKSREMNVKNQEMAKKNDDLVMQQKEIEEKSTQIMKLLEAERENKWLNEGIVLIGEVIRKNKDNTRTLAQQLLSNLIQYLDVQYGGFFIYRKESDTNEYLELIASYGFDSHRNQERKILCNEGITGACFTEKKLMRIDNLPESYVIVSGLGKAKLNSLVLIPLKLHGDVTGVIEIAAVGNIGDKAVNLLETIAENIASNLLTLEAREQIEKLYKASQDQTARLHEQEEEMRQQMEELQATQEENHRREMKLLAEIEELKKLQKKK